MIILGIETSCDETAVCLLETRRIRDTKSDAKTEYRIIENVVNSQADLHAKFGGVFPMMAKREHEKNLPILAKRILEVAQAEKLTVDRIAVTKGPGLEPALWAGVDYAEKLGEKMNVPVIGVNHMEGHILGSLLESSEPENSVKSFVRLKSLALPALALLISGGHTELVLIKKIGDYEVVGRTKDDAVGEAFDKVARLLGLAYPGGPHVSALAEQARTELAASKISQTSASLHLPRPMLHSADLDFSFSGLKTAVLYEIRKTDENASMKPQKNDHGLTDEMKKEIAREFEDAVTEVLVKKTAKAVEIYGAQSLVAGGGVTANKHIRKALEKLANDNNIELHLPPAGVSGDNALMIALAGSFMPSVSAHAKTHPDSPVQDIHIQVEGNLSL